MINRFLSSIRRIFRPAAERKPLVICRGDEAQLERLIAGEIGRRPGISRKDATLAALERYRLDQR